MLRQRHQTRFALPITAVFPVLIRTLGESRWNRRDAPAAAGISWPRVGCSYAQRRGSFRRRGRVLECLPPVTFALYETLLDPPCQVHLRLRWRLEPMESESLLRLEARYQLNAPAYLNRRRWRTEIHAHCVKLLRALELALSEESTAQGESVCNGHRNGNSSMTATNTTTLNGSPSLR